MRNYHKSLKSFNFFIFLFLITKPIFAYSESNCSAIFNHGIHDTTIKSSDLKSQEKTMDWFCNNKFRSYSEAKSLGIDFKNATQNSKSTFNFNQKKDKWDDWYEKTCKKHQFKKLNYSETRDISKTINESILNAFNKCTSKGLSMWIEHSKDSENFSIAAKFINNTSMAKLATIEKLTMTDNVKCKDSIFSKKVKVGGSTIRSLCKRTNNNEVVIIANADHDINGGGKLKIAAVKKASPTPVFNSLYLSDIEEIFSENIHGGLTKNRTYWQDKIIVNNVHFENGLGMHPIPQKIAKAAYRIPKGAKLFNAKVAMACQKNNENASGDFEFIILLKNKNESVNTSNGLINGNCFSAPKNVKVSIHPNFQILELQINPRGTNHNDHATWIEARFE